MRLYQQEQRMRTRYPALVHNTHTDQWMYFVDPVEVWESYTHQDVRTHLQEIEERVHTSGLYAVGFLAYEAATAFDAALPTQASSSFPLLWFGLYPKPHYIESPLKWDAAPFEELEGIGHTVVPKASLQWSPSIVEEAYYNALQRIKEHIARGNTYQVNYTFRLDTDYLGSSWSLFQHMLSAQTTSYASYMQIGRFALCSASPELFFTLDGETLRARPMKGTAARGPTSSEDHYNAQMLYYSEKNRAENVMIVDMLRNDMSRIAEPGSVHVPHLYSIEPYPTVWQMTSDVHARTRAGLYALMEALFPCASITGAPKARTMQIIQQLECSPRNVYTGTMGFYGPERQAQFNVAIRTVCIDRNKQHAQLGIGGGIVWDSDIKDEYEECLLKARFLTQTPFNSSKHSDGNRNRVIYG